MNANQAINMYRSTGTQGGVVDASPHRLVTMLMGGALDRIAAAKGAMSRGETARQGELIGKSISIIDNLRASLDHSVDAALSGRLSDLYDYMERRLLESGARVDEAGLDEVAGLLREIKSGWDAIPESQRG